MNTWFFPAGLDAGARARFGGLLATLALSAVAAGPAGAAEAAQHDVDAVAAEPAIRLLRGVAPQGGGHGTPPQPGEDEITPAQRAAIWQGLRRNLQRLPARAAESTEAGQPKLGWPLRQSDRKADPDYHGISNFVDLNPAFPNQLLDYQCGGRSYDTTGGYNHQGIDYITWPFGWLKMSQSAVEVVAAAPGRIVGKDDGNADQSCGFNGNPWNAVYIEHNDGSIAWYGHLKNGTATAKAVGDSVVRGEYLGVVGSSGNSTAPHLHLELYDAAGQLVEPHAGSCNALGQAWWDAQRPYADSKLNQVMTGWAPVNWGSCPAVEVPNQRDSFAFGEAVYFTSFYHDQQAGQVTSFRIARPDGSTWSSWNHSSPGTYSASWWYWWFNMPATGPAGTWTFSVTYQGQTIDRHFNLGAPTFVKVRAPNGGETYTAGAKVNIKWQDNLGGPVRIELWRQGQYDRTLFTSTPSDGKAVWTVPAGLPPGNYKLQIINLADETVQDGSNQNFRIQ